MVTREAVAAFFKEGPQRPLRFKEIASLMGLSSSESRSLKRVLRAMVHSGEFIHTKRGHYGPSEEMAMVTGLFEAHREGYGFVVPLKPGEQDVFVPARATSSAMDGDMVVARVESRRDRQGRIVRVLQRAHTHLVGYLDLTREACFVRPKAKAINFDIYIPPGKRGGARRGQKVMVEITAYPEAGRPATGRVLKVLQRPEGPQDEVDSIIEEFGLPRRFPTGVRQEAAGLSDKKPGKRKDLRRLATVTIDGERAKDFDDAVSIKADAQGYTLWVHIADVGHYVGWDSLVDLEARKRGTSVYFPDRVVPMLPRELSEDLCSLRPGLPRLAMTVQMEFGPDGVRREASIYPSVIQSDERMTYTSVSAILVEQEPEARKKYSPQVADLQRMQELASLLRDLRFGRGSLDFDLPEPEVLLDIEGMPEDIIGVERNFAHFLIEEFMIAANEAVAEHMAALGAPMLYRVHEKPELSRVSEALRFLKPLLPGPLRASDPGVFSKMLAAARGKAEEELVTTQVLRSLKQARYLPENVGHFGLASKCYAHFTSPIRRYPDLVVHRVLKESLKGRLSPERVSELGKLMPTLAVQSSRAERVADMSESQVVAAMRAWFMLQRLGDEFEATVVGVTPHGLRIRLKDYYIEGSLPVSSLTDDYYLFSEKAFRLKGRHTGRSFSFGQSVTVVVEKVDTEDREVSFGLVG